MTDLTKTTSGARPLAALPGPVPLYRWMDGAGLLLLAWAVILAWLGRPGHQPASAGGLAAAGPSSSLHMLGLLLLAAFLLPLVVTVLTSFGIPGPNRSRGRWGRPALASLGVALALPLIAGQPGLSAAANASADPVAGRGGWDDAATGLAAAGVALLVIRPARLSGAPRWAAIGGCLASGAAFGTYCFQSPAGLGSTPGVRDYLLVAGIPLTMVALAALLAIGLVRAGPWAAGGLFIWGLATACQLAVPRGLPSGTWPGAGKVDGPAPFNSLFAGAAAGGAVCAGTVLVTQLRGRRDPARRQDPRGSQLCGALCVSAFLAATVFVVPFTVLAVWGAGSAVRAEIWIVLLPLITGLIGCALMAAAGLQLPRRRVRKVLPIACLGIAFVLLAETMSVLLYTVRPPVLSWPGAATSFLELVLPVRADVAGQLIVVPVVVLVMLLHAAHRERRDAKTVPGSSSRAVRTLPAG